MTVYSEALDQLLDQVSTAEAALGLKFTAASITATGITTNDPEINKLGAEGSLDRWVNRFLYVPSALAADRVRSLKSSSTAAGVTTILHNGPNTATGSAATAYILALHPDLLMAYANDALEKRLIELPYPVGQGPADRFFEKTTDADWDDTNASDEKQVTSTEVLFGARTMKVLDDGSGGGYVTQAAFERVGDGKAVNFFAIAKGDVGTSALDVIDGAGNEQVSVEFNPEAWLFIAKRVQFDAGDVLFKTRLEGVTAAAEADWNAVWYVKEGVTDFMLPSWMDKRTGIKAVIQLGFKVPGIAADTWLAESVVRTTLQERLDWDYLRFGADVNPNWITIKKPRLLSEPMFLLVNCKASAPYGVDQKFSAYDGTNVLLQDELVAQWMIELATGVNEISAYGRGTTPLFDGPPFAGLHSKGESELKRIVPPRVTRKPLQPGWSGPTGGRI